MVSFYGGRYPVPVGLRESDSTLSRRDVVIKTLTLLYTDTIGWVIATLPITRGTLAQQAAYGKSPRTYSISIPDGKLFIVGLGPHVRRVVRIHITKANKNRLALYRDLHDQGLSQAYAIRDQIATRRINSIARRAAGFVAGG